VCFCEFTLALLNLGSSGEGLAFSSAGGVGVADVDRVVDVADVDGVKRRLHFFFFTDAQIFAVPSAEL
jgi:hypothetical protein